MSDVMIVGGEEEESPKKSTLNMSAGLGLIKNTLIDQHFAQRGRIGRLLSGVCQNPEVLGTVSYTHLMFKFLYSTFSF